MGVYINGMEIPTGCGVCPFNTGYYYCAALRKYVVDEKRVWEANNIRRLKDCPIIEAPEVGGNGKSCLTVTVNARFDDIKTIVDEVAGLQTYKLFEDADFLLVDRNDVVEILKAHVKADKE